MLTKRWEKIEQVFNKAIAVPVAERVSFVKRACGADDDLLFEIISLLEADIQSDEILEQSVFPLVAQLLDDDFSELLEKSDFASYKLKKLLGKGGMGAVFLAEDTRLERFVALKVLPSGCDGGSETVLRFQQEAKAVSAISHQNVAHIYEFGEHEGMCYFAMEYVPGKTLRDALDEKPIKISTAVEIALQIAFALEAAHAEEIVHRDIKPENIMLRQRAVVTKEVLIKVLDFGLAKLGEKRHGEGSSSFETMPGLIMGTTAYMSPEQVRGETIDERTDLWSLGVVLYEMTTGKRPFGGNTASDVRAAILLKEPAPLPLEAELPELSRIVNKALEKDVALRYQSAKEIINDLRSLQRQVYDYLQSTDEPTKSLEESNSPDFRKINTNPNVKAAAITNQRSGSHPVLTKQQSSTDEIHAIGGIKRNKFSVGVVLTALILSIAAVAYYSYFARRNTISSIAVLPFVNAGNDSNTEYLSDGISESLINNLSQIPGMKVIARNSSFKFKGKEADLQEVANVLGAQAIVTGKITQLGDRLIVSVEMINAHDKTQMWGEQYNRKASDLFQVQSEISKEIAGKLHSRLTGVQEQQFANRELVNSQAYEILLKGRFYSRKGGKENLKKAVEYFNEAIAVDPDYTPSYADLSLAYIILVNNSVLDPKEFMPKAEGAARKALELDESFADAHYALAQIKRSTWQWAEAEREYKRALELNPNLARAHSGYAYYLCFRNRHNEALSENKRSKELDPLSLSNHADTGNIYYLARQYDPAIAELNNTLELDQSFPTAHVYLGYVYSAKGMYAEAITAYRKAIELSGETSSRQIFLGAAFAKAGESEKAREILKQLEASKEYVSPGELAILYAALGMREEAFASLEKAYAARDLQLQYLKVDPAFDLLRDDLRFNDLLQRIGFEH
jgi:serine/threonine protein kinase/Flp pilus assembly protein TadD